MTVDEVAQFATVAHWLSAFGSHWNRGAAEADQRRKLEVLLRYCEFAERVPDALVANLLRETPTGQKIWLKRRRAEMPGSTNSRHWWRAATNGLAVKRATRSGASSSTTGSLSPRPRSGEMRHHD